ncbi:MAG: AMP-dependent synthetase/ligase, partial [Desulfobacteraceae bacterium]
MKADTIPRLLERRVKSSPNATALYSLDQGHWQPITWKSFHDSILTLAGGFQELGLAQGQAIGIMARTSPLWDMVQFAVLISGGIVVGMDPHDLDENINLIAEQSNLAGLVVQEPGLLRKLSEENRCSLSLLMSIEDPSDYEKTLHLKDLLSQNTRDRAVDRSSPSDPATIIFTSGTTGRPKGIQYTHGQVTMATTAIMEGFQEIGEGSRLVCWLPLSNLFQRMINFCGITLGATTYYVESPRDIMKHLPSIGPDVFLGVPRFFEKLYEGMMVEVDKRLPWRRALVKKAIAVGDKKAQASREGRNPGLTTTLLHSLLDPIVLAKFREAMGPRLRFMISGSAPMPVWLLERFHAMGLLILEAYGISEDIIPVAMNLPRAYKFGTVGKPMPGNEIRLLQDGEVLVKGPGVFSGYLNEASQGQRFTPDGYLMTGDRAVLDQDGFLSLRGRKSEVFKTSTGRKIAPTSIEDRLRRIPYIDHAVIIGSGRKQLVALLVLSSSAVSRKAADLGLPFEGSLTPPLEQAIAADVSAETRDLPLYQQPAGLILTLKPFTIEGGELTGNLKLRRENILLKFQGPID